MDYVFRKEMYGDQSREFEASRVNFYVEKSNSS